MEQQQTFPNPAELHSAENLPIMPFKKEIQDLIIDPKVKTVVISAGTGAGKTRMIPQFLKELMGPQDRLLITQPRRLTTETSASTLAIDSGSEVGEEIGYQHGQRRVIGENTQTIALTEGSLLRKIGVDPLLSDYSYVMIDEWHERHKETDFVTALLLRAQKLREEQHQKPLKLLITSATIDGDKLVNAITGTKKIEIPGRLYPITPLYEPDGAVKLSADDVALRAAVYSAQMIQPGRNLIIFMPGEGKINETYEEIASAGFIDMANVRKLYGKMSQDQQAEAINVDPDKPRIIIATNVAETGLTISNADVISSGFVNIKWMDQSTGLEYLLEMPHTKNGVTQQRGRAGRTGPGSFRFLGTKAEFDSLEEYKQPEVTMLDLMPEALLLDSRGIKLEDLGWIDKPNPDNWVRAQRNLFFLGAVEPYKYQLTDIGKEMVRIPADPHIARALVEARKLKCLEPVISAASLAQTDSIFIRGEGDQQKELINRAKKAFFSKWPGSDFLANLDILRQYQKQPPATREAWAKSHYLRPQALEAALDLREKLLNVMNAKDEILEVGPYNSKICQLVERSFVAGFVDKLMYRNGTNNHYTLMLDQWVANLVADKDSAANQDQPSSLMVMARNYSRSYKQKEIRAQMCQRAEFGWLPKIYQKELARRR